MRMLFRRLEDVGILLNSVECRPSNKEPPMSAPVSAKNVFYAQSGGVTAVINASACGVIETARKSPGLGKVYAGRNGIIGALREELIDTSLESDATIAALRHTPSGAFGSCRYKLKSVEQNRAEYERLIEVFKAHDIGYFFYNGGGDSQDTANKVAQFSQQMNFPITCIGVPKTVDNDLPITDCCPGFGSVAKYVAVSIREAGLDVASMCESSTKVFVMEVMGRHAGWIAGAAGLAAEQEGDAPHIIVFPEIAFDKTAFLAKVKESVGKYGYCAIVVSEGAHYADGTFRRSRRQGRVWPCPARWRSTFHGVDDQTGTWLQISLGRIGLFAARRAPHCIRYRRGAGLCDGQGSGGVRPGWQECCNAYHRARE